MVRDCPKCGLGNPPTARRCDCGHDFATGRVADSFLTDRDRALGRWPAGTLAALACLGMLLGAAVGIPVALALERLAASRAADAIRVEHGHVSGYFAIPYLIEGIVLGTLLGGVAGLLVALLLGHRFFRNRTHA